MRDDLAKALSPSPGESIDPVAMARKDLARKLPAKFFKLAAATDNGGVFALTLDGRGARTPGGNALVLRDRAAVEALAAEWNALVDVVDPGEMPLTRLVNSALDGVARDMEATRAEVAKYAGSDLLCYRADEPASLVAAQAAAWDPPLDWARAALGADFRVATGIVHVDQPAAALAAVRAEIDAVKERTRLAAMSSMTSLTGSALLTLAVARGRLSALEAWAAAHVDEDYQARAWGGDAEAEARRARRWREMEAAALLLRSPRG
jgi:chaperone required for assembly of F1-ATPase